MKIVHLPLPYTTHITQNIHKHLIKHLSLLYPMIQFRPILSNHFALGNFFKHKDELPLCMRSRVVYKFSCPSCPLGTYIGYTERPLGVRIAGHQGRSFRTSAALSNPEQSAVRNHAKQHKNQVLNKHFSIIDAAKEKHSLLLLESLHIKYTEPHLNSDTQSTPLLIA